MSGCKAESTDSSKEKLQYQTSNDKGQSDPVGKYFKGYSSMVFLKRGKHKRRQSRSNLVNLSKDLQGSEKKTPNVAAKKGEVLGFEEVSSEFTCDSSLVESYHLNTTKEAKFSFRKLEDGTFALETKNSNEPEKSESGLMKRSSTSRRKKGRYSHKPLKICFKKRSKALRKPSDSQEDYKKESTNLPCSIKQEDITCAAANQDEDSVQIQSTGKTWATFKRLVTRRKKLNSSLKRPSQPSAQQFETNTSATCIQSVSQKKRFSNLRIPCMNFSRGKRSANVTLTSEDLLCTINSSENCATESVADSERSDEVLAAKYRLQRSLDVENRNSDGILDTCTEECPISENNLDQKGIKTCEFDPLNKQHDQEIQSSQERKSDLQQDLKLKVNSKRQSQSPVEGQELMCEASVNDTHLQSTEVANGPLLNEDISIHEDNISHITEVQTDDTNTDSENELSLVNDISDIVDPKSDIYEFLLIRTAASLVSKVIQQSIQQIVTEDALHNHVPCKASERFYI
ncbi:PREDICTED: A-kinase anchor protein 5 [Nanorana parkeri]|uniref:A-kinase anchor protein 5 n=1 Tax=Nanorana parkeri TaxID=125878 RepID=UPI0008544A82|nr:PREDICTED: A-kinase anchor protein 5 [Nanorana parkeri]